MLSKKSWRGSSAANDVSVARRSRAVLTGKIGRRIESAFRGEGAKWRAIGGIARETGLSGAEVRDQVGANDQLFVRAPVSPGGRVPYSIGGWRGASGGCGRQPPGRRGIVGGVDPSRPLRESGSLLARFAAAAEPGQGPSGDRTRARTLDAEEGGSMLEPGSGPGRRGPSRVDGFRRARRGGVQPPARGLPSGERSPGGVG